MGTDSMYMATRIPDIMPLVKINPVIIQNLSYFTWVHMREAQDRDVVTVKAVMAESAPPDGVTSA